MSAYLCHKTSQDSSPPPPPPPFLPQWSLGYITLPSPSRLTTELKLYLTCSWPLTRQVCSSDCLYKTKPQFGCQMHFFFHHTTVHSSLAKTTPKCPYSWLVVAFSRHGHKSWHRMTSSTQNNEQYTFAQFSRSIKT